jgi:hypothetical protein
MNENGPPLHDSGCEIKNNEWVGYVALIKDKINAYRVFVGKPEGKKPIDTFDADSKIILKRVLKKYASRA